MLRIKIIVSCSIFIFLFSGAWLIDDRSKQEINHPLGGSHEIGRPGGVLPISNIYENVTRGEDVKPFSPREYVRLKPIGE